ncbi:hypothetical protein VCHA39O220_100007 [Vibrio chagasii]|nr:hypothetical protein VCHA27O13_60205 [Vibrio chagasii]CAH6798708.1 hypothetical protein VCHA28FP16_100195 [Vibrio chagasii]CAH6811470.1 hypothetical protein VCHA34O109_110194 [Vibrio chagasii]CAH6888812.1 hypothetical protein VCHA40O235_100007 [Vibrio chagasii]CAH6888865.1 hypothetical protein VCHA42P256_100008 [Vibrio chagasii]
MQWHSEFGHLLKDDIISFEEVFIGFVSLLNPPYLLMSLDSSIALGHIKLRKSI